MDNTEALALGGIGGAALTLIGGGLVLWQRWRTSQIEAAKGDIDVKIKEDEATDKRRQADAVFRTKSEELVIERWQKLAIKLEGQVAQLETECDKRQAEHMECQKINAGLLVRVEYLTKTVEELRALQTRQSERIAVLENRQGPTL